MRFLLPALLASLAVAQTPSQEHVRHYRSTWAPQLQPLLSEVLRFPTIAGNDKAHADQKAWLFKVSKELGFVVRDAGMVTEIELPGPAGAPVIGLVVHGDVQPVDDHWTIPPFSGEVKNGIVLGRGAADDKGPLVQALLAMKTLADAKQPRTHTLRLLVGSDEESGSSDMAAYLKAHQPPDYSLVLDSAFPVVVGEKAWNALTVETDLSDRKPSELKPDQLKAGLAPSIVPDEAMISFAENEHWAVIQAQLLKEKLQKKPLPQGISLTFSPKNMPLTLTVHGRAAHAGVNAEGGRNALVALAKLMAEELPAGGAKDLLSFAQLAGQDLKGTGLGIATADPVFGYPTVVPSLLKVQDSGKVRLTINIRSTPALSGETLKKHLFDRVAAFNARTGAHLEPGGFFGDSVLASDPKSKLVQRLMAAYARATGKPEAPAISGGGTYAKRLPHAIAFGMWFPDKPYPGHDVDEQVSLADLHKGVDVLLEALADLAYSEPLKEPFKP
jgi:succinyl-diaminopimelate desuccinylase